MSGNTVRTSLCISFRVAKTPSVSKYGRVHKPSSKLDGFVAGPKLANGYRHTVVGVAIASPLEDEPGTPYALDCDDQEEFVSLRREASAGDTLSERWMVMDKDMANIEQVSLFDSPLVPSSPTAPQPLAQQLEDIVFPVEWTTPALPVDPLTPSDAMDEDSVDGPWTSIGVAADAVADSCHLFGLE